MAAHLRPLDKPCPCGRRATVALFNTWNAHIGDYCQRCGDRALRDHQARHEGSQPSLRAPSEASS